MRGLQTVVTVHSLRQLDDLAVYIHFTLPSSQSFSNIKVARDAVCSLIMGAPPGKVYNHMRQVASRLRQKY